VGQADARGVDIETPAVDPSDEAQHRRLQAVAGEHGSFDFSGAGAGSAVAFDNIAVTAVPEPSTVLLMLVGGAAVLRVKTRRRV